MPVLYKVEKEKKQEFLKGVEKSLRYEKFPPQVIIETTAACNLKCSHCGHASMKRRKGNMSEELWRKIVDEIAEYRPGAEVWPTFYGEALILKNRIAGWIRYAADKELTNLVLNTNGTLLTDELMNALMDSGLHRLIISLDGFTKQTFEKIRCGANYEKVYRNAERLLELKEKRQAKHITVEMQFSMMDENENEVDAFRNYWLARGAYVKTREKLTWTGTKEASNLHQEMNRIACPWAIRTCAIHWNGDMVACAVDYEGGFIAGSVRDFSIGHLWNTRHRQLAELHLAHEFEKLPALCRACLDWQVGGGAFHEGPVTPA